jgi:hypothetical protein
MMTSLLPGWASAAVRRLTRCAGRSSATHACAGTFARDGKIVNDRVTGDAAPESARSKPITVASPAHDVGQPAALGCAQTDGVLPGHPVSVEELSAAGFRPLALKVSSLEVDLPTGSGCEWTAVGEVPDAAGLYTFTVEDGHDMRVTYVGQTSHLWMVTKGHLPGCAAGSGRSTLRSAKARRCNAPARKCADRRTAPGRPIGAARGSSRPKGKTP